jgi:hypothetical protein
MPNEKIWPKNLPRILSCATDMKIFKISGTKVGKIDDSSDGMEPLMKPLEKKEIANTRFNACNTISN